MVEDREGPGEGVDVQDTGGAGDAQRDVSPGRVAVPAGPARIYGGERPVRHGASLELDGQYGAVVYPGGAEEGPHLGVDAARLRVQQPAQRVGDVDGVVHERAAARELRVKEPAVRYLTVVRPVDGQDAPDPTGTHDLSRPRDRRMVPDREGDPELPPGRSDARIMATASSTVVAMGFSHSTCAPPSSAAMTSRACSEFSEQTITRLAESNNSRASSKKRTPKPSAASTAPGSFVVRHPDEVGVSERAERRRVLRGVDVGEAEDADPDAHPCPPSVTGRPVLTDSVAASPILSAS